MGAKKLLPRLQEGAWRSWCNPCFTKDEEEASCKVGFLLSSPTSPSSPHVIGFRSIHAGLQVLQYFILFLFAFLED
jgi:hypothetical protein